MFYFFFEKYEMDVIFLVKKEFDSTTRELQDDGRSLVEN